MADKKLPDEMERFEVDAPDIEGADSGWDDWDDFDVDVPDNKQDSFDDDVDVDAPAALSSDDEAASEEYEFVDDETPAPATPADLARFDDVEEPEVEGADNEDWDDVDVPALEGVETPALAEPAQEADAEAEPADEAAPYEELAEVETTAEQEETPAKEVAEDAPTKESVAQELEQEVAPAEEAVEQVAEGEELSAEPEKSEEERQREEEELEAYRNAMGESNAELADISEYRNFRKKTKTESKSSVPKKNEFDLFANRYKVKTMNAMVAASDPIVYFYNACLKADGSIVAFNVYQVLQDRFLGKMVPQLFTAVAESSSKIDDLNEANLIEQLKVCAEYPEYDFIISITSRFFTKPALLERFLRLIPEGGVPNLVLAFDCTSLENIAIAAKAGLGAVKQKGVKVLLDNTEKVTMTVLSEFDYDIIRIDSRYYEIGNPRAESYLKLLLNLTKEQGVTTIASFCDSEDLSEYMFFMGVDAIQGNAISRPMRTVPNAVRSITLLPSMLDM